MFKDQLSLGTGTAQTCGFIISWNSPLLNYLMLILGQKSPSSAAYDPSVPDYGSDEGSGQSMLQKTFQTSFKSIENIKSSIIYSRDEITPLAKVKA